MAPIEIPQITLQRAAELTRFWQDQGEVVVFTNGCFDVLHRGHIWLFEQARQLGQRFIIAVNNDDYLRRVKGPNRPVQLSSIRRQIVAAVSQADIVLPLDDDNPRHILETLKPTTYILGSDYRDHPLPGAEHCGQVVIVDRLPGLSTTELITGVRI